MKLLDSNQILEGLLSLEQALGTGQNPSPIALDLETTGLRFHIDKISMLSWATRSKCGIITLRHFKGVKCDESEVKKFIRSVLTNPRQTIILHNAKFDIGMMISNGWIELHEIKATLFDTMIAQHLLDPVANKEGRSYALKELAKTKLRVTDDLNSFEKLTKNLPFAEIPFEQAKKYSGNDAYLTYWLYHFLRKQLKEESLEDYFYRIEMPHVLNLVEMELRGLGLGEDPLALLTREISRCTSTIDLCREELLSLRNVRSRKQILRFLKRIEAPLENAYRDDFTHSIKLNTPSFLRMFSKTSLKTTQLSLAHIIRMRGFMKERQKYEEFLKYLNSKTKRLHCNFNQKLATGRSSASRPNILELSKKSGVRDVIQAGQNSVLVVADFSQIDLRVIADLSAKALSSRGDLLRQVNNGYDLHLNTLRIVCDDLGIPISWRNKADITGDKSKEITQKRNSIAKPVNFGISYGLGPSGLVDNLNNLDHIEAKILIDDLESVIQSFVNDKLEFTDADGKTFLKKFQSAYPEIRGFQELVENDLLNKGFTINHFGRACVPPIAKLLQREDIEIDAEVKKGIWMRLFAHKVHLQKDGLTVLLKSACYLTADKPKATNKTRQFKPKDYVRSIGFPIVCLNMEEIEDIIRNSTGKDCYQLAEELSQIWKAGVLDHYAYLLTPGLAQDIRLTGKPTTYPWIHLPNRTLRVVRTGGVELNYGNYGSMKRKIISYVVQSTSMDFSKIAMAEFRKKVDHIVPRPFLVNCVHDEIVVECHEKDESEVKKILKECMEDDQHFRALAKGRQLQVKIIAEVTSHKIYGKAKG